MVKNYLCYFVVFICLYLFSLPMYALTPDEIIRLKEAGVDDRTIQMMMEQEKTTQESSKGLDVKEIKRPDGGRDKIYYSITTPEEEIKNQQEERGKLEKSWEMLRHMIIDERSK